MPAALHRLPEARVPQPAPPVPPAPAPGRYPYCLGQPVAALRSRVEMAAELLRLTGRPFDWDSAVADYMVETDGGKAETWGLEDRAARWGWDVSKSTMYRRMKRVREDAADRADLYRAKRAADEREARRRAAAEFGAPSAEGDVGSAEVEEATQPNPSPGLKRGRNAGGTPRNDGGTEAPYTDEMGQSVKRAETVAEQPRNGGETPSPYTPRAFRSQTQTEGMGDGRQRAREACRAWGVDSPAVVAEAEDRAEAGRPDGQLVRNALRLGLTGQPPDDVAAALDTLDAPAAAALAVVTLRTGRARSSDGRARYLLSLAASLLDHDTAARYADAHPETNLDAGADPDADGGRQRRRGGAPPDRRNARERANQLSAVDLADSAANSLALLRADPDFGDDATGGGRRRG